MIRVRVSPKDGSLRLDLRLSPLEQAVIAKRLGIETPEKLEELIASQVNELVRELATGDREARP